MNRCDGWAGRVFGHAFEARYSLGASGNLSGSTGYSGREIATIAESTKARTYHGDVCRRCGQTANRPGHPHGSQVTPAGNVA